MAKKQSGRKKPNDSGSNEGSRRLVRRCRSARVHATPSGLYAQESTTGSKSDITFTSWTGPYMRSQMLGFVRPYEEANGTRVHVDHYAGGIDEIRDQVESANVVWDVVDLTQADSLRACNEGLLENLEGIELPDGADGTGFATTCGWRAEQLRRRCHRLGDRLRLQQDAVGDKRRPPSPISSTPRPSRDGAPSGTIRR